MKSLSQSGTSRLHFRRLDECCTLVMGQSPPGESYSTEPVGMPFFQGKADFGPLHPQARVWCSNPLRIAEKEDILICVRAPVGPVNVADQRCCIGRGLAAVRPRDGMDGGYLYWWLRNSEVQLQTLGSGSTFQSIGRTVLATFGIPVPPLADQQRIAAKLDEQMAALDRAQSALDVQSLTVDDAKSGLLRSVLQRAASRHGGTAPLPSVCTIVMGQSPPGDTYNNIGQGIPFYQGRVDFGELSPATRVWCSSPQKIAEAGDVLLCVRAPVGPTNIASERCCIGRGLAALHCKPMLDPMFLLWTLRAREDEWSMLSAGSTFEAITRAQLDSLTLLVPSEDEQKAIAEQMSEQWQLLSSTKNLIATRHEQVAHLRVALLDAAFSGEI